MNDKEKQVILEKAKQFFRESIVNRHKINTEKLKSLSELQPNPFLMKYLANFAFGTCSAQDIAKALVYPRVLGSSINTSFGMAMQTFCSEVLDGFGSTTKGIDIEFIDQTDNRKKYCQIKAGPNTINKDDVTTIKNHFTDIRNLARTNRLTSFNSGTDCIVGVFYGQSDDLSSFYKEINTDYPVYIGQEFWYRLTGDEHFYSALINSFAEVADEVDGSELLEETIEALAQQITKKYNI